MEVRPEPKEIPDTPGSYQFLDAVGRIIYVGKAKSLRKRISTYFGAARNLHPRTAQMVAAASSVEWLQVNTEVEALMLEYSLIQRHQPRFNVKLRDDKSYPFLAVTTGDEWPRAMVMRGQRKRGNRYFGPYGHAYAIRETLNLLLRTFPIRTCSDNKLAEHQRLGRPCLLFHIEQCAGPCVKEVSRLDYDEIVNKLVRFLEGDTDDVMVELEQRMNAAGDRLEFELAARLRDRLTSVRKAIERQQIAGTRDEDFDVIGISEDELEAAVQVFYVRRGRVMGQRGLIVDKVEQLSRPALVAVVLQRLYHEENPLGMPKAVLVPDLPEDLQTYCQWLSEQRALQGGSRGGARVSSSVADPSAGLAASPSAAGPSAAGPTKAITPVAVRVPQRGSKRSLLDTVTQNAKDSLTRHRLKRGSDYNSRAAALVELQQYLDLPTAPLRIECYDMSHLQGTNYVGSMVVLEDGLPAKREYRRFKLRGVEDNDDYAAMEEVLTRRLRSYLNDLELPVEERGKFAYPPQLLLVDGGKGQLGVASKVVKELALEDVIAVAALAKQFEEVFVPGRSQPVQLPRQSEALYLLQRVRDESHRFAVSYHRQLRAKSMKRSILDDIAGLGPRRRTRLLKELGGITAVRRASLEQLQNLPWLPEAVVEALWAKLRTQQLSAQPQGTGPQSTGQQAPTPQGTGPQGTQQNRIGT